MIPTPDQFIEQLNNAPEQTDFHQCMSMIGEHFNYTPARFYNGLGDERITNDAGTNEGSCKIFAFAKHHNLDKNQTLACFGDFYRIDVLQNPGNSDHANIRTFMRHGWKGISMDAEILTPKTL